MNPLHQALVDWTGPPPAEVTVREGGDRPLVHYIDGVVTAPPLDVLARVREADLSGLAGDLGHYEVLADAPTPPFTRRLRYLSRLPWPWRPRAFVVEQRFERLRDGAILMGSWSVEHDAAWPETADAVRAALAYSGWRLQPHPAGAHVRRIISFDLRAWIPGLSLGLKWRYTREHQSLSEPSQREAFTPRLGAPVYRALFDATGAEPTRGAPVAGGWAP